MYQYTDGLESERLVTRFLTMDDAATWMPYFANKENSKFIDIAGDQLPAQRAQAWMEFCLKRYRESRYGLQALVLKDTGEMIGQCGLLLQEVDGLPELEIGYHLLLPYWGKGYAAEAARLFRDYAFGNNMAPYLVSIIHPGNTASKKVAMRNGMTLWKPDATWHNNSCNIFRITREEWGYL